VVLASRRAFDHKDMHVLDRLRGPLVVTTRLAVHKSIDATPAATAKVENGQPDNPRLTAREIEVLRMVAEGLLARTIADKLEVSARTVHKHLGNVYKKLDAHDRLMAVRRAESLGLLSSRPRNPRSKNHAGVLTLEW
jgi:DNA-binding NarL/FixJ family response regulator